VASNVHQALDARANDTPPASGGNGQRDQSWPGKGRLEGLADLNGDFFNAIGPQRTCRGIFRWGGLRGYDKGGRGHAVASQAKPELLALLI
jgi:hypothetical protein